MLGQIHEFDVYIPSGDAWAKFNTTSPLRGRFVHNTINTRLQTIPVDQRQEDLAARRLQYPADFDMPDNARIYWFNDPTAEGAVTIWNVVEGTESQWHGVGGYGVVNTCQVNRIGNVG